MVALDKLEVTFVFFFLMVIFTDWLHRWWDRRMASRAALLQLGEAFGYVAGAILAEPELARIRARLMLAEWRVENRPVNGVSYRALVRRSRVE